MVDSSTSSSDFDSTSTSGQAHHKRRLLRTLAYLATAATDNDNAVLEVKDAETSSVQASNGTRKRKSNPKAWKKNKRKLARNRGEQHIDSTGKEKAKRNPQSCECQNCGFKRSKRFTEEMRSAICKHYWELGDYKRQKDFLLTRINILDDKRERPRGERKRLRKNAAVYTFIVNDIEKSWQKIFSKDFEC